MVAVEAGQSLRSKEISQMQALVLMCRQWVDTRPIEEKKRVPREESPYTVVYRTCGECRKSAVVTPEGPVEISPEVVERVEADAQKVVIPLEEELEGVEARKTEEKEEKKEEKKEKPEEGSAPKPPPNSQKLTRRVLLRDALLCANPWCPHHASHAHHIQPRSEGGVSALWNEVALCVTCHALRHQGLLEIEGDPVVGLRFRPCSEKIQRPWEEDLKIVAALGIELRKSPQRKEGEKAEEVEENGAKKSARADFFGADKSLVEQCVGALEELGYRRREARERLEWAEAGLVDELGREPTPEELVFRACRGRK